MPQQERPVRTIKAIEVIEKVPLAARLTVRSTYELIREAAAKDPERTAITLLPEGEQADQPVRLSYRALLSSIQQTANLLADLGLGPQEVIALLLPDLLETQVLLWGGQAAGIVCPIPPWLPAQQIVALLQAVNAKILVVPGSQISPGLWLKTELVRREVKAPPCSCRCGERGRNEMGRMPSMHCWRITRLPASTRSARSPPTTSQCTSLRGTRLGRSAWCL
jgi:acyl-coenzyme A synthetase/AMP-(fatty) acid ligase